MTIPESLPQVLKAKKARALLAEGIGLGVERGIAEAMSHVLCLQVSKIAKGKNAKAVVFRGGKEKTKSGLTKA